MARNQKTPKRKVKLSDGTVVQTDDNKKSSVQKPVYNKPVADYEMAPPPDDQWSKLPYPPPKNHPIFRKKWGSFIDSVISRSNFNPGHLELLEILCDLHVDVEKYSTFLRVNGHTYKQLGYSGDTWKTYPEVALLRDARAMIQQYTAKLDLFPKKDNSSGKSPIADKEWE